MPLSKINPSQDYDLIVTLKFAEICRTQRGLSCLPAPGQLRNDLTIRPSADLVFDVPAGATVAGWRGFSAATGGTNYGGEALTSETFNNAGQYKLIASETGILHQ